MQQANKGKAIMKAQLLHSRRLYPQRSGSGFLQATTITAGKTDLLSDQFNDFFVLEIKNVLLMV